MASLKLFTSINRGENKKEKEAIHILHQLQLDETSLAFFISIINRGDNGRDKKAIHILHQL
jgi:hypothetical protein